MEETPRKFFWGSATSAHQVEGGNRNDWSEWEKKNAGRLAEEARRKKWPTYVADVHPSPLDHENYISGRACDHYHRFREDFDIACSLGHNAHRFSVEWSRIEPEEGRFNEREIEHYREVIKALRERGMEPFVTLWHWTLPVWLSAEGGVLAYDFPNYFERYAKRMAEEFPGVMYWITLNETNVYTVQGYWRGAWPPGKRAFWKFIRASDALSKAHRATYGGIHDIIPDARVGVAHHVIYSTRFPAWLKNFLWNDVFLLSIKNHQDFIGINYYRSDRFLSDYSDMGWVIDPEGLSHVLKQAARFGKPIFILENGIADSRDDKRARFVREHVSAMERAMREGADVRGYFYWSLLDNFEWDKGFWPRFGLVEVDYTTLERKIRPSAREYKKIIEGRL
jgi:beta-glucosidase